MEKALKMGKVSVTGSFKLFIGKIASTVILAVGTIILGIFILEGDYGLYAVALIPTTTMLLFQDWGIGSAMTKYCAHYRVLNKDGELRKVIVAGLTFQVATGVALTAISLVMANFIASTIFGNPESALLITLASITIVSTALSVASQSVFVGFERMGLTSILIICSAIIQSTLCPLLVYLGYGALGAILGYTISSIATGIMAVTILYFAIFRKLSPQNTNKSELSQTLRTMLRYGIPLAIATILTGLLTQFYAFMMASSVDLALIGNYKIATNFAILLAFFTMPITTVLFPAFSKLNPQNERHLLKTVFTSSVKYTALFLVPATMAIMVLAKPIIGTIYGNKWLYAPFFLALYVISNLFAIFGTFSRGSLLTALGETKMLMKLNILTLFIGVPLAFFLIPQFGIIGVIVVTLIAGIPSMLISIHWTWKHYDAKIDFKASAKIFLASTTAATATYLFVNCLNAANWVLLATGVALFLAIYLTTAPLIGAINQKDIDNLRAMFSGLGIISKILKIPLVLVQKVLKIRRNSGNQFSPATEKSSP